LLLQLFAFGDVFMSHCNQIIADLRQRGYRITPQREMIIDTIAHNPRHMSAEEVYEHVKKRTRSTNIATIYRTLDLLWEQGFACRNDLGAGKIVYATYQHGPHIHLVCRQCNQVIEADPDSLAPIKELFHSRYNFSADLGHLSLFGECIDCQNN
jgi:Fur family ferric uptake transcriptional regulator